MNGVHDMGGMHGFGEVEPEASEPVFHAPWEGRALAMNRAMGALGLWNIDIGRFSREQLPPTSISAAATTGNGFSASRTSSCSTAWSARTSLPPGA